MLLLQSLIAYAFANAFFWLGWFFARMGTCESARRLRVCEALLERLVMEPQDPQDRAPTPYPDLRPLYIVPLDNDDCSAEEEEDPSCGSW